jgi:hypothetical protein
MRASAAQWVGEVDVAFAHRVLDADEVGPAVWRVIGDDAPAPLRGMVARGLAPLPPRDLVVALYQIWVANDPEFSEVAAKTVEGLPPPILFGALDDPKLPAGVLDFLGRKLPRNADVLHRVVAHRALTNESLAGIARVCPESVCDDIAENQERWLAHPPIVEALYQNPNCRMSVIHRVLELAVRENIHVRLPNMDEIRQALLDGSPPEPERDELFKQVAGAGVLATHAKVIEKLQNAAPTEDLDLDNVRDELPADMDFDKLFAASATDELWLPIAEDGGEEAPTPTGAPEPAAELAERVSDNKFFLISKLTPMQKIRLALLGSTFERFVLIRDSNKMVAMSAIKSPRVNENEVISYASNRTLARDIIEYIAKRRDWTKLYSIQLNLVLNPKTPLAIAMNLMPRLYPHDVKKVAFSKNVPSALATAARRRMEQRK